MQLCRHSIAVWTLLTDVSPYVRVRFELVFQHIFKHTSLSYMWNDMVQTNELCTHSNDGIVNGTGNIARRGN